MSQSGQCDSAMSGKLWRASVLRGLAVALLIVLVWLPTSKAKAHPAGTNASSTTSASTVHRAPLTLQERATGYERTGRKREAAALYEEIVRTNISARKVLSHQLVRIYTETGETNNALTWAHEVMRDNPDPQAYLAGVHERLGQTDKAREILEREIAANTNATRAVTLRWQFANLCNKTGDVIKARALLTEAAAAANGTAMEVAARRRLEALTEPGRGLIERTPI